MTATYQPDTTAQAQAAKLLKKLGTGPLPLEEAAVNLVAERYRVRRRAIRYFAAPTAVAGAAWAWYVVTRPTPASTARGPYTSQAIWATIAMVSLAAAAWAAGSRYVRLADARMSRTIPRRATREVAIPLSVVLGPRGVLFSITVIIVDAADLVFLVVTQHDRYTVLFAGTLLIACFAASNGVRSAMDRPALAVDQNSLAVDERLRAREALNSLAALVLPLTLGYAADFNTFPLLFGSYMVCAILWAGAGRRPLPWVQRGPTAKRQRRQFMGRELPFYRPAGPSQ